MFDADDIQPALADMDNSMDEPYVYCDVSERKDDVEKCVVDMCVTPQLPEPSKVEEDSSDDMDFFRSLLPMLRTLSMQRKLQFRMDVMQTLLDNLKK